jgi:hypothetical protein
LQWSYTNALLYAWTTITTIGYGYIYPITTTGRALTIVYQIIGIPFTLVVLKDITFVLAKLLNMPGRAIGALWRMFRYCTLRAVDERDLHKTPESSANKVSVVHTREHTLAQAAVARARTLHQMLNIPTIVAVLALAGWMCIGTFLLCTCEPQWTVFEAVYFLFNSLTTTGIGDVPVHTIVVCVDTNPYIQIRHPQCHLPVFVYIFIGLAVLMLFANLIYAKVSLAYWTPEQLARLPIDAFGGGGGGGGGCDGAFSLIGVGGGGAGGTSSHFGNAGLILEGANSGDGLVIVTPLQGSAPPGIGQPPGTEPTTTAPPESVAHIEETTPVATPVTVVPQLTG